MADSREHDEEPSGSVKGMGNLDWLSCSVLGHCFMELVYVSVSQRDIRKIGLKDKRERGLLRHRRRRIELTN